MRFSIKDLFGNVPISAGNCVVRFFNHFCISILIQFNITQYMLGKLGKRWNKWKNWHGMCSGNTLVLKQLDQAFILADILSNNLEQIDKKKNWANFSSFLFKFEWTNQRQPVFFNIQHSGKGLCEIASELFKFKRRRKFWLSLVYNRDERRLVTPS